MLSKEKYIDTNFFKKEVEEIFETNWIYVGTKSSINNNNDFITKKYFGNNIVIQNFKGEIVALQNVCTHRFNPLQDEDKGNRPLVCKYHSWNYNKEGKPRITNVESFNEETLKNCDLNLKKYHLDFCGDFMFLHLSNPSNTLKEFLGAFYDKLSHLSSHIGEEVKNQNIIHNCNWKLLVENVLECYHCTSLHSETLVKSGFGLKHPININFSSKHSEFEIENSNESETTSKKLDFLNSVTLPHNTFHHIYIYPNFFFSSTEGKQFYIGIAEPVSENKTILKTMFFLPLFIKNKSNFIPTFQKFYLGARFLKSNRHLACPSLCLLFARQSYPVPCS
jgi:phenylpropionate dioxygenase-like ring-hydroxylating dioxygenase large terminal subunit